MAFAIRLAPQPANAGIRSYNMAIPTDPQTLLTRDAMAQALTEAGFPVSPATLATKASRGGGPPFRKFGPKPLYPWGSALRWAQAKLGPVVSSTSELDTVSAQPPVAAMSGTSARPLEL
jgi:hypothetical protein